MKFLFAFIILNISFAHAQEINNPFEDINRATFKFNESLDNNFLKPVAKVYSKAPSPVKKGVSNFFNNLEEVETTINQVFQGKPGLAMNDFTRFIINTTIGLGGFFDVATQMGLEKHEEDFSQTLGKCLNRPNLLPVPGAVLKILLGDGAKVVLEGQKVISTKLKILDFKYPLLEKAIYASTKN